VCCLSVYLCSWSTLLELKQWKNPAEKLAVKSQIVSAFAVTKSSTASAGKFDEKLKNEPRLPKRGLKRKLPNVVQVRNCLPGCFLGLFAFGECFQ
jgi:hypothetical protein